MATGYTEVYEWSPQVSGFFLGGLIQVMVIFGFHWSIVPIIISNIATYGYDTILPFMGATTFAQAGAALPVYMGEGFIGFLGICVLGFALAFVITLFMKIDTEIIEKVSE